MKKNNKGTLFWVTGFSGSGKTQISKKIYPQIKKKYGNESTKFELKII
mgnify:CR=1 FL=1